MGNDLDRDLAIKINELISDCLTLVQNINDNKYVPHITQQPVDFTGAIGDTATFTVVANNIKEYQWQWKAPSASAEWRDTTLYNGYNTNQVSLSITSARMTYSYRCKITGLDNSIIYTNAVNIIAPET